MSSSGALVMRLAYGFAMQAIGLDGATASVVGRRLGISK
jgi:hypothetical protein